MTGQSEIGSLTRRVLAAVIEAGVWRRSVVSFLAAALLAVPAVLHAAHTAKPVVNLPVDTKPASFAGGPGKIAYLHQPYCTAQPCPSTEVHFIEPDGSNDHKVYDGPIGTYIENIGWSPSGDRLSFYKRQVGTGDEAIVVMDADGANAVEYTFPGYGNATNVVPLGWTLDESKVYFLTLRDGGSSGYAIVSITLADGTVGTMPTQRPLCRNVSSFVATLGGYITDLAGEADPEVCTRELLREDGTIDDRWPGGDCWEATPDGQAALCYGGDSNAPLERRPLDGSPPVHLYELQPWYWGFELAPDESALAWVEFYTDGPAGGTHKEMMGLRVASIPDGSPHWLIGPYEYSPNGTNGTFRGGSRVAWQPRPVTCATQAGDSAGGAARAIAASVPVHEQAVGPWVLKGCFDRVEGETTKLKAVDAITLDGIELDPASGAEIIVDTAAKTLTSTSPLTVKAGPLSGPAILDSTVTSFNLANTSLPLNVPGSVFGLPLKNPVTAIQATASGKAKVPLKIQTPGLLGGVEGAMELVATGTGIDPDSIKVRVDQATLGGVAQITDFDLKKTDTNWAVTGKLNGAALSGAMSFADGKVTAGSLSAANVTVASLFKTNVALSFGANKWTGSWSNAAGQALDASFSTTDNAVTAASLTASDFDLFGVAKLKNFAFALNSGAWSLAGTTVLPQGTGDGVTISSALTLVDGVLTNGSLSAANIAFGQAVVIKDLSVAYNTGNWNGSFGVVFPGSGGLAVNGTVGFANGAFSSASINGTNLNLPLGPSVTLKSASAALKAPSGGTGWMIDGSLGLTAGPTVAGKPAMAATATAKVIMLPKGIDLTATANVTMVDQPVLNATIRYRTNGTLSFDGTVNIGYAGVTATGNAKAIITSATDFVVQGSATVNVVGQTVLKAKLLATPAGITGCGKISTSGGTVAQLGFAHAWTGATKTGDGARDNGVLTALGTTGRTSAAAAGTGTFTLPGAIPSVMIKATGTTGAPTIVVTAPDGSKITAGPATKGNTAGRSIWSDTAGKATYLVVDKPKTGKWTVAKATSGAAIAGLFKANGLPTPVVAGTLTTTRAGHQATLTYKTNTATGQTVRFTETGPYASQLLATTTGNGTVTFLPSDGPAGNRTITAIVEQDGLPRRTVNVKTFTAPAGYRLTITVTGNGNITTTPASTTCTTTCAARFNTVTLTATPANGNRLSGWTGACTGTAPTCPLALTERSTITAKFVAI